MRWMFPLDRIKNSKGRGRRISPNKGTVFKIGPNFESFRILTPSLTTVSVFQNFSWNRVQACVLKALNWIQAFGGPSITLMNGRWVAVNICTTEREKASYPIERPRRKSIRKKFSFLNKAYNFMPKNNTSLCRNWSPQTFV